MKHSAKAYTIIEIMLVLAISGALLVSVAAIFNGKGAETQFSQGMQDLRSEIEKQVNDVGNGVASNFNRYSCSVVISNGKPRAQIQSVNSPTGTSQGCLLLGKAFELLPGSTTLYTYTILGNRLRYNGGNLGSPAGPVTDFNDANPTAAISPDLTTDYHLNGDLRVKSTADNAGNQDNLAGFYTDLSGSIDNSTGGGVLMAKGYPSYTNSTFGDRTQVKSCIEGGCTPRDISSWFVCLENSAGDRKALLTVKSSAGGITIDIKFDDCSLPS